jgi:prepilin peptidase CpaA
MPSSDLLTLAAFVAVLGAAGWSDLRRLIIPNRLSIAIAALWLGHVLAAPGQVDIPGSLGVAVAVFAIGLGLFAAGLMGGGDVKLLAVTALWAGPEELPELLLVTSIIGAVIALALLSPHGSWLEAQVQDKGGLAHLRISLGPDARRRHRPMPYGLAIALGGCFVAARLAGI